MNNLFLEHYNLQSSLSGFKFLNICYIQSALCSYILGNDSDAFNKIVEAIHPADGEASDDDELYYYAAKFASRLGDLTQVDTIIAYCLGLNIQNINRMVNDFDFLTNDAVNKILTDFIRKVENRFKEFKRKYKGRSEYLIYENINASLNKLDNSIPAKFEFLEYYTEEYISKEVEKEIYNRKIDEKINLLITQLNIEIERSNQYVSPINNIVNQMNYHKKKYEKSPYNDIIGIILAILFPTFIFAGIYLSFKYYDSNNDSFIYQLFFNPLIDIFLVPIVGFGLIFFIRFLGENYRENQYKLLQSEYSEISNKKNSIDVGMQKFRSELSTLSSNKYQLKYIVKQF